MYKWDWELCSILLVSYFCSEYKTQTFQAVLEMLRWFAGDQVRNVAVSVDSTYSTSCREEGLCPVCYHSLISLHMV